MNWLRNSLIAAILVICYFLFIRWNDFQERQIAQTTPPQASASQDIAAAIPNANETAGSSIPNAIPTANKTVTDVPNASSTSTVSQLVTSQALINVSTDVFNVKIDPVGGDIVGVSLKKHFAEKDEPDNPFVLLTDTNTHTYVARSGLVSPNKNNKLDDASTRPLYKTALTSYLLAESDDSLVVDLVFEKNAAVITKRFTFEKNSYLINVEYIIENRGSENWVSQFYGQILRDGSTPTYGYFGMRPFLGAAITNAETNYEKISFGDMDDEVTSYSHTGGWVSLIQHYFLSAWVPPADQNVQYELKKSAKGNYVLQFFATDTLNVEPNQTKSVTAGFYAGPKNIENLEKISPHLELTVDFGWLWFIAKPIFKAMDYIHDIVGNWGVSIIILTFLIKLLFLYPSAMSYRSMAKMRKLQPKMAEMKERLGDDRAKMSQELMKLYRTEKVNPLGGCLPVLLQMPVFISLYYVIMESVELRHEPFFLWIQDLSVKDPLFILPLLMGLTMFAMQKLNPTPPDPMQAKIMQMLPIFFTFLFMFFPAGLVLYWVVNNTLSFTQQYIITKQIEKAG